MSSAEETESLQSGDSPQLGDGPLCYEIRNGIWIHAQGLREHLEGVSAQKRGCMTRAMVIALNSELVAAIRHTTHLAVFEFAVVRSDGPSRAPLGIYHNAHTRTLCQKAA